MPFLLLIYDNVLKYFYSLLPNDVLVKVVIDTVKLILKLKLKYTYY